jgi:hypothetical protein
MAIARFKIEITQFSSLKGTVHAEEIGYLKPEAAKDRQGCDQGDSTREA